jgi:hypothetical protein
MSIVKKAPGIVTREVRLEEPVNELLEDYARFTIRKFNTRHFEMEDLIREGTLDHALANHLEDYVLARKNILISGGTGTGKTRVRTSRIKRPGRSPCARSNPTTNHATDSGSGNDRGRSIPVLASGTESLRRRHLYRHESGNGRRSEPNQGTHP